MSGVLLLQEILKMNGYIDEYSVPVDNTYCAICGITRKEHQDEVACERCPAPKKNHQYSPARFVVAHSDIDRSTMHKSLAKFNSSSNLEGNEYKIILGSRIIREGLNFKAIRHQFILSIPTDYPTLIQIFGRVVRKNSHIELPEKKRDVHIKIYVSTRPDGKISPELQKYIDKGKEFLVIQQIEKSLRTYAIDGFVNYPRLQHFSQLQGENLNVSDLNLIPYNPKYGPGIDNKKINSLTYNAYDYVDKEISIIESICKALFHIRSVWTFDDLWNEILKGIIKNVNIRTDMFSKYNLETALQNLSFPFGKIPQIISKVGNYYICSMFNSNKTAELDIESYIRERYNTINKADVSSDGYTGTIPGLVINLKSYLEDSSNIDKDFKVKLKNFEKRVLSNNYNIDLSLVDYHSSFHYNILRKLISDRNNQLTLIDEKIIQMYKKFKILITTEGKPTGYVAADSVISYNEKMKTWVNINHSEFKIGKRYNENNILVGFTISDKASKIDDFMIDISAKFKIRPPLKKLKESFKKLSNKNVDLRTLSRGAVCETRPREELTKYLNKLTKYDNSNQDSARFPSANKLCLAIKTLLLKFESEARNSSDGMLNGLRWCYLFNDRVPSISSIFN
jgi:hypothetical protein